MFLNTFRRLFSNSQNRKARRASGLPRLELLSLEERITPSNFYVFTNADSGTGSLRQAIIDANATAGDDNIDLFTSAAITLASALPNIIDTTTAVTGGTAGTVTIRGGGNSSFNISGNQGNFNIFTINTGGNLTISGLIVSGANTSSSGGAFNNQGTLNIANSTISGNTALLGGGIFNTGTLNIANSTLSGNTALLGGGIFNTGTLTVSNSTLSGNTATSKGGGIYNTGILTVTNSTLFGNTAGSGGGGGIYNGVNLNIANTIIANSTNGGDYAGSGGVNLTSPSTAANNLVSQGSFSWATTKTSAEINLGPLQNNGGFTFTMALLPGSAAIGAGNSTISNAAPINGLDQRGFNRNNSDIGAYSFGIAVTTTADTVDSTDNLISLREAITLANTTPGNDTINFSFTSASGNSPYTITLDGTLGALPTIVSASTVVGSGTAGTVTINGLGASSLTISGSDPTNPNNATRNFNIFNIDPNGNLSISDATVSGAKTNLQGGAFLNKGTLTVTNSTISGNSAVRGGGIYSASIGTVTNSTISGNTATGNGFNYGGIGGGMINNGTLSVTNSTISGNSAVYGGGISNGSNLTVFNCTLSSNIASSIGGGILNGGNGILTLTSSTLSDNSAAALFNSVSGGGGIFNSSAGFIGVGIVNITNTIIANSTSGGDYSGIGSIGTNLNNLVEDGSITGTIQADPLLGPLQNNGGPTFTMALGAGSPAIGAGNAPISNTSPINSLDQRGFARSYSAPSIGAYEYNGIAPAPASDFIYTSSVSGVTITGYIGAGGAVNIPKTINGEAVIAIGDMAFKLNIHLTSVTIPSSVRIIGAQAFYGCTSLTSINSILGEIGAQAFSGCTSLTSITLIGARIQAQAFNGCTNLASLYFNGDAAPFPIPSMFAGVTGTIYYKQGTIGWSNPFSYERIPAVAVSTPTVTLNTGALTNNATTVTITGTNFVPTPSMNAVTFSSGAGHVTSATSTQLIVTFDIAPALGGLTAIVTSFGGTSTSVQVANILASTTTALTSSTNPSIFGQSVTFAATVATTTPGAGTANGTIRFYDNGAPIGNAVTLTSGSANSAAITNFGVGTHNITAVYSGGSSFATSTSSAVSQIVNQASTTTALAITSASVFGQSVTFTATVAANSPGAGTASGTVTFKNGSTIIGTGTLTSGTATLSIASLAVGSNSITAVYSGDSSFATSTSSAMSQIVNQASTTTTLATTSTSVFGQSVTFTATVAANSPGAGTATGTIRFYDNGVPLGNAVTLTSGSANSAAITNFGVGTHNITAVYSGDASFVTSTSSAMSQIVNQASTTTTLATTNPSVFGQSVTFTATVAANSPGAGTASGTIRFYDNGVPLGNAVTLTSGSANSAAITNFGVGTHNITAVYSGDSNFVTSTSSAVSQIVNQASTTTTLATTSASVFGQSITFTATVAATAPGAGIANGYVLFFDGGIGIGFGILSAGTATTAAINNFGVGTHNITAVYSGDSNFATSTSSAVSQVVNLGTANTPTFGTLTSTAGGFTVQISNYNGAFTYGGTATAGGTVAISSTGLVTVTGVAASTSSTATITTIRTGYANGSAPVTATSNAAPSPTPSPSPTPTPTPTPSPTPTPTPTPTAPLVTATPASSPGGSSTVTLHDPVTGAETGTAIPFPGFSGPIKVISADFNNDGVADIIAGAGFGGGPAISILNSQTGEVMESFFAFAPSFTGGVFIAVQDVNGDGILDIIAGAGPSGGPEVRIFNGDGLTILRSFFAYDPSFTGGVSVASIDFNNDNILDIVTGAGPGAAPHVKVFDGATNAIISQWYAYPASFTGGVFVAAGDIGNDGNIEVLTGAGAGGAPVVAVWNPYTGALLAQFMAYAGDFTGGVRVGINDGNSDGIADILTGAGPGGGPQVNVFNFPALDLLFSFYSGDPTNTGGVFVS